jgi:signal peptidase II
VVIDQLTKMLVRAALPLHSSTTIVPGFLDLTHVRNTGAAFGMLNGVDFPFKTPLLIGVAIVALFSIGVYATQLPSQQRLARVGLALVLAGAVGNLIDRVRTGYVLDFVDVYWRDHHFWAFNVADSAITIGVSAIILDLLLERVHASHPL